MVRSISTGRTTSTSTGSGICRRATQNRSLGYILNGWQLSGIYRYMTGAPYNVFINIPGLSGYGLTGTQQVEGLPGRRWFGNPGTVGTVAIRIGSSTRRLLAFRR
jgi:hypothetical protein